LKSEEDMVNRGRYGKQTKGWRIEEDVENRGRYG